MTHTDEEGLYDSDVLCDRRIDLTTQPQLESLIDLEGHYQVATSKTFPFVIKRGDDVWVYTSEGER